MYTWTAGEQLTAAKFNTHLRDKFTALKVPAGGYNKINEGTDYTTTSTSFTDIDATDMALTVTTGGGDFEFHFSGCVVNGTVSARTYFDVLVDGVAFAGDDGLLVVTSQSSASPVNASFSIRIPSLSAASHTFKVQWKVSAGTSTMHAGAGTANYDLHPTVWGKEIA